MIPPRWWSKRTSPATEIPTLSPLALALLALTIASVVLVVLRRAS
jgi:hypothetical protein